MSGERVWRCAYALCDTRDTSDTRDTGRSGVCYACATRCAGLLAACGSAHVQAVSELTAAVTAPLKPLIAPRLQALQPGADRARALRGNVLYGSRDAGEVGAESRKDTKEFFTMLARWYVTEVAALLSAGAGGVKRGVGKGALVVAKLATDEQYRREVLPGSGQPTTRM
eukprot:3818460-Rhodomonas_salina.1